jgi:hypothetical protein
MYFEKKKQKKKLSLSLHISDFIEQKVRKMLEEEMTPD